MIVTRDGFVPCTRGHADTYPVIESDFERSTDEYYCSVSAKCPECGKSFGVTSLDPAIGMDKLERELRLIWNYSSEGESNA